MTRQPHSAAQFGEQRDFWWNRDFLDLMAHRWRLNDALSIADIGCGVGHWSRLLFPRLGLGARVVGLDREAEWVVSAAAAFRHSYPEAGASRAAFIQSDATSLPFADNAFDAVTSQTLLMHLARPRLALAEMVRVARPGGIVICVEPNNLVNSTNFSSLTESQPVEAVVRRFEFWLRYQRGKIAGGKGDNSIGDLLPGMFVGAGLVDIMVFQSDRCGAIYPPYDKPEQQVLLDQMDTWKRTGQGPWDRADVFENVRAGGGTEQFFEVAWNQFEEDHWRQRDAVRQGMFHAAEGGLNYLVSGRKRL